MEQVRHHVKAAGKKTLKEFFDSDNVKYDPKSKSLRDNIRKAKCQFVYTLCDGSTGDDEERQIRDALVASPHSAELIRMVFAGGGWAGLDDELPEAYLDDIARQIAQVLDQRDYVAYQLIRRHLSLLDYGNAPNLGDVFLRIADWPLEFRAAEYDAILANKDNLLKSIASAAMRNRVDMIAAARILDAPIQLYDATAPHRENDLITLMHEVNYTARICTALEAMKYEPLYAVLLEMADPNIADVRRRTAARNSVDRLRAEFAGARNAVKFAGNNEANQTVDRFTVTRQAALDNFSPNLPAPNFLTAVAAAVQSAGATLADIRTAITNLPDIASALTLPALTGSNSDDKARAMISEANSQNWLAATSSKVKVQAINALLSGTTDDDDEIAINLVLRNSKANQQAELYQLAAAATWESLYSSIDGDEYDELENILSQPA